MTKKSLIAVSLWSLGLPVVAYLPVHADGGAAQVAGSPVLGGQVAPTIRQVVSLQRVAYLALSPDGGSVVYSRSYTDWQENRRDSELWLKSGDRPAFQLTRTAEGSSHSPVWSPDGQWIAFLAERPGFGGDQIQLISPFGGEARPLTRVKGGIASFQWLPSGQGIVARIRDRAHSRFADRRKELGRFEFETDPQESQYHLWLLRLDLALAEKSGAELTPKPQIVEPAENNGEVVEAQDRQVEDQTVKDQPWQRLTRGPWSVNSFDVSADSRQLVFSHRPTPGLKSLGLDDLSILSIGQETSARPLVHRLGSEASPRFSPDGCQVVFVSSQGKARLFSNSYLAVVEVASGETRFVTGPLDGRPRLEAWSQDGIYFRHWQRTAQPLFRLLPVSGEVEALGQLPSVVWGVDLSADGSRLAAYAQGPDSLAEIWSCETQGSDCQPITDAGAQLETWNLGSRQTLTWKSRDGLEVEGVLYRPDDFDPAKKYPLLVMIHGGPVSTSFPDVVPNSVYPLLQFLNKGALVLMPNYRGSDGYGGEFRAANRHLLGKGDAWDVLSGVEHLIEQGWVDPERVGAMGWSQGGFISAYLATTSDRFRGISVGAGISDWSIYYTNTDLRQFTVDYLSTPPWHSPELYDQTSPLTFIRQAKTPTLIQHGDNDKRVPTANAHALFRGLQDVGAQTELIIYKNTGHGIRRPKERLAATLHNWHWFLHTIWQEPLVWPAGDGVEGD